MIVPKEAGSPPIYGIEADSERTAGASALPSSPNPVPPPRHTPLCRPPSRGCISMVASQAMLAVCRIYRKIRRHLAAPARLAMICSTGRPPSWGKLRLTCHPSAFPQRPLHMTAYKLRERSCVSSCSHNFAGPQTALTQGASSSASSTSRQITHSNRRRCAGAQLEVKMFCICQAQDQTANAVAVTEGMCNKTVGAVSDQAVPPECELARQHLPRHSEGAVEPSADHQQGVLRPCLHRSKTSTICISLTLTNREAASHWPVAHQCAVASSSCF